MTYYTFSNSTRTTIHGMRKINGTAVKKKNKNQSTERLGTTSQNNDSVLIYTLIDALTNEFTMKYNC